MIYLQLFISYLKIGFFGFGGGYAMLSLIQNEVVVQNGWMTNAEFADIVAVSQMTPGPIAINSATYVGYTVAGFWGSVVATLSVCQPALTLMILITKFFLRLHRNRYVKGLIVGMRPVVAGMIGAAVLLLLFPHDGESFKDVWSWLLFGVALVASHKKVNPILLIVLSAVAGVLIYYLPTIL
jgi:chromate transporter